MAAEDTLRDSFNTAETGRLSPAMRSVMMGELMTYMIKKLTATETGVTPSSNVATLAAVPTMIFQVNVTAGTSTGIKKLLIGSASVTPAAGQCRWTPGSNTVTFAAADAATAVSFTYAQAADSASIMTRQIGEQD